MARILMVAPPLTGHINPATALAAELGGRGHEVAWAVHAEAQALLPANAQVILLPGSPLEASGSDPAALRGRASVRYFYEQFCLPLARASCAPLEAVVRQFRPDLLVVDHQMVSGALVARRCGIGWVSLVTTNASILQMAPPFDDWLLGHLLQLQRDCGVIPGVARPDFSPYMQIVFSSHDLIGPNTPLIDAPYAFVGPAVSARPEAPAFPWEMLDQTLPRILVSLGTVSRDNSARFFDVMLEALAPLPLQAVVVAPPALADSAPANVIIRAHVPQLALLPHMSAVVCHAGHNTVCEALLHGLPLVVAPIRDDQPVVARQVVDAGAGRLLRFGKFSVAEARAAIGSVLTDTTLRSHAMRLGGALRALGGQRAAADVVDQVLARLPDMHKPAEAARGVY